MNAVAKLVPQLDPELDVPQESSSWLLKELKPKHRQICSLIAQGFQNTVVAQAVGCTPEYITMLLRQPLIKECLSGFQEYAEAQLGAMFVKSVSVIGETLDNGNYTEKMKAARLQLEVTGRVGSRSSSNDVPIDSNDRLQRLAARLLYLQGKGDGEVLNMVKQEDGSYAPDNAG